LFDGSLLGKIFVTGLENKIKPSDVRSQEIVFPPLPGI
jgi:hypothetical protein